MLEITPTGWAGTLAVIAALLALDWYVLGRRPHVIDLGEAARWSVLYVAIAVLFGVVFGLLNGWDLGAHTSRATSSRRACRSTTCSCSCLEAMPRCRFGALVSWKLASITAGSCSSSAHSRARAGVSPRPSTSPQARTLRIGDGSVRSSLGALTEGREAASTKPATTASTPRLPLQA
jgi:hypothetical protein